MAADDSKPIPVMLAGVECMAEGHSFHRCNNVILMAYSWAYDRFIQAINRIHRLNSVGPVNVYSLICASSVDRKLEANIQEKGDAAELVLDGQLIGQDPVELNLAELLQIARDDFNSAGNQSTLDESRLVLQWPALAATLAHAMASWDLLQQPPSPRSPTPRLAQQPAPIPCDLPLWRQAFRWAA
jgi:hypothetical protein